MRARPVGRGIVLARKATASLLALALAGEAWAPCHAAVEQAPAANGAVRALAIVNVSPSIEGGSAGTDLSSLAPTHESATLQDIIPDARGSAAEAAPPTELLQIAEQAVTPGPAEASIGKGPVSPPVAFSAGAAELGEREVGAHRQAHETLGALAGNEPMKAFVNPQGDVSSLMTSGHEIYSRQRRAGDSNDPVAPEASGVRAPGLDLVGTEPAAEGPGGRASDIPVSRPTSGTWAAAGWFGWLFDLAKARGKTGLSREEWVTQWFGPRWEAPRWLLVALSGWFKRRFIREHPNADPESIELLEDKLGRLRSMLAASFSLAADFALRVIPVVADQAGAAMAAAAAAVSAAFAIRSAFAEAVSGHADANRILGLARAWTRGDPGLTPLERPTSSPAPGSNGARSWEGDPGRPVEVSPSSFQSLALFDMDPKEATAALVKRIQHPVLGKDPIEDFDLNVGLAALGMGDGQVIFLYDRTSRKWTFDRADVPKVAALLGTRTLDEAERAARRGRLERLKNNKVLAGVIDEIFLELQQWSGGEETLRDLALRYGVDLRNIVWGLAVERLEGAYDPALLGEFIDAKITEGLDEIGKLDGDGFKGIDVGLGDDSDEGHPHVYDPPPLEQQDIQELAKGLEGRFEGDWKDSRLKQETRQAAIRFLYRLEENFVFNSAYSQAPTAEMGPAVERQIEGMLAGEIPPILREVLLHLRGEVQQALPLQEELHRKGLNKGTFLNLYQLIGVKRMLETKRLVLGDDMGLGKTLQVLCTFLLAPDARELLVVAPKFALTRWLEDIRDHIDRDAMPLELVMLSQDVAVPGLEVDSKRKGAARFSYLLNHRDPPAAGKRVIFMNYQLLPGLETMRTRMANELAEARSRQLDAPLEEAKAATKVDFAVFDEAHFLKNSRAKQSNAVWGSGEDMPIVASRMIFATGTPIENRIRDPFVFLRCIARIAVGELAQHGDPEVRYWDNKFATLDLRRLSRLFPPSRLDRMCQFHAYFLSHLIRRLAKNVMKGLPKKEYRRVVLDTEQGMMRVAGRSTALPGKYSENGKIYQAFLEDPRGAERSYAGKIKEEPRTGEEGDEIKPEGAEEIKSAREHGVDPMRATQILRLQQAANGPQSFGEPGDSIKFDAAKALIDQARAEGKSVMVVSGYKTTALPFAYYLRQFDEYSDKTAYIDGEVSQEDRRGALASFQEKDPKKRSPVLVATLGTMSLSVQATQASVIIFMDYPWKPSEFEQTVARVCRFDNEDRHYPGKKITIYSLEMSHPLFEIDSAKSLVLKRKTVLEEMGANGHLTPDVLAQISYTNRMIPDALDEVGERFSGPDPGELSLQHRLHLLIGYIFNTHDKKKRAELWKEAAGIYLRILEQKGSFFANMANLDHLSEAGEFPELQGHPLDMLDLASGPSTLKRAYARKRRALERKGLRTPNIVDYDLYAEMLAAGVHEGGGSQVVGSLDKLGQALAPGGVFETKRFDVINLAYAYHYASDPAALLRSIRALLKPGGIFTLLLPGTIAIPESFYDALAQLGYKVRVGRGQKLKSSLDEDYYQQLLREHGREVADDVRAHAEGTFTYMVAAREEDLPTAAVGEEDLRLALRIYRELPEFGPEKVKKIRESQQDTERPLLPEGIVVGGEVVQAEPPADHANGNGHGKKVKITSLTNRISMHAQRLALTPHGRRKKRKGRDRHAEAADAIELAYRKCIEYLTGELGNLTPEELRHALYRLEHVFNSKFVHQWFGSHPKEDLDALVRSIKLRISAAGAVHGTANGHPRT